MSFPVRSVITGDLGPLAIELAEHLLRRGHDVTFIAEALPEEADRRTSLLRHHRFSFVRSELRERQDAIAELSGADRVFLMSGTRQLPLHAEGALERLDRVVRRTVNVLDASLEAGATLVVATPAEADVMHDSTSYRSGTALQRFAFSSVKRYHEKYGLAAASVSLPEISTDHRVGCLGTLLPLFVQRALRNEDILLPGRPTDAVCVSCLHDVVPALAAVAESGQAAATVYALEEETTSVLELARRAIRYTGSRSAVLVGSLAREAYIPWGAPSGDIHDLVPHRALDALMESVVFDLRVRPLRARFA